MVINGDAFRFPIDAYWYESHFDQTTGQALPRHRGDTAAGDVNLLAGAALAKANEILMRFRAASTEPTPDEFRREYASTLNKVDFVAYFAAKAWERFRAGEIQQLTYDTQMSSYRVLVGFAGKKKLPFAALSRLNFATKFEAYMVRQGHRPTTRWARHKDMKTYLKLAQHEEKLVFAYPYQNYKVKKAKGTWQALAQRDVQLIDAYYRQTQPGEAIRPVLRRWLFSLASAGLRISDAARIGRDWRIYDVLVFRPWKGRKKEDKILKIPLSQRAQELWDEAIQEHDHPKYVFTNVAGKTSNEWLHWLEDELGLKSKLFNHVARRTYGTLYLANGGMLHVLQENLGHSDIKSTMIYVEVLPDLRESEARKVDAIFGHRAAPLPSSIQPPPPMRPTSWYTHEQE
jgi:integrase